MSVLHGGGRFGGHRAGRCCLAAWPAPAGLGLDGADGDAEGLGGLGLGEVLVVAQDDRRPLPGRQGPEGGPQRVMQVAVTGPIRYAGIGQLLVGELPVAADARSWYAC